MSIGLALLNSGSASDFSFRGQPESNRHFRLEFPALTSSYYLVHYADAITNPAPWALTGLVLGVEGTQAWRNEEALAETLRRFYRISRRDQSDPADSDSDGMDDVWELRHGLAPLDTADAALDPDEDGFSNLAEYQAGTNPRAFNPAPQLAITSPRDGGLLP